MTLSNLKLYCQRYGLRKIQLRSQLCLDDFHSLFGEDAVVSDRKHSSVANFVPILRSGEWSDIGNRHYMEDTHICISDLAKKFGYDLLNEDAVSFYGVFDGHGGKAAAQFVHDHLPRVIVEDSDFPLELEKVVTRSFLETDTAFRTNSSETSLFSALTAMIFGRSLVVANAGDCRAVVSRRGVAIDGIWDVLTSQNAVHFARRRLVEHNDVKLCCKEIVGEAIKLGSSDNLTVVMVSFLHPWRCKGRE